MNLTPPTSSGPRRRAAAAAHGELLARVGQFALELLALVGERRDTRRRILRSEP